MISECLKDIDKATDIDKFYNQESPNKNPPLLICKDKLLKQNKEMSDYKLNVHNINSNWHIFTNSNVKGLSCILPRQ